MYEQILYEAADWVATITLNRPDKLNAWTRKMEEELTDAIEKAIADDTVRAIVLTGAGRGFCAGADMSLLSAVSETGLTSDHRRVSGSARRQHSWLLSVPKPLIAAINGPAVGLGFVIPLYCDFRLAAASASFNVIFSRRGLIAEYGLAWMLPRLVGLPKAIEMMFTSRKVDAREALSLGLVHRVLPDEGFRAAAQAFASELATSVSPRSLRVMKQQLYAAQSQSLDQAMETAITEMLASLQCEDFREGVAHFLEKREPRFTGR
ncbi:MAG: enoyl-CoA hydratase/isomerase family protein [Acidobacteria bacterium]|nr:enoyl-CoA hydratase/isomerase family protein [Acidobacteriota bacterium]